MTIKEVKVISFITQEQLDNILDYYPDSEIKTKYSNALPKTGNVKWYLTIEHDWLSTGPPEESVTYEEWEKLIEITKKQDKKMKQLMLDVLEKTYNNLLLRKKSVPLFMSNPGIGKTTIIKEFADSKGVNMLKMTLSQRMPNEVVGMMMPNMKTGKLEVFDSYELNFLKDGDILFIDEVFNGTLKQTLDAFLNLLEDRSLPSGKKMANIMIVAASNPQGVINLTPQIKERFVRHDLKFNAAEYQEYLLGKYGIPENISAHFCTLINKEKFDLDQWNYNTPRSIEKALMAIGCDKPTPYSELLLPFLNTEIDCPKDIVSLNLKKDDKVPFLTLFKGICKRLNELEAEEGVTSAKAPKTRKSKAKVESTPEIVEEPTV
jgi:hypothetical protein